MAITVVKGRTRFTVFICVDEQPTGIFWRADWRDHADRLICRRLGDINHLCFSDARDLADAAFRKYYLDYCEAIEFKSCASFDELEEATMRSYFPRHTVAGSIRRLCDRIARWDCADEALHNGRYPGLQLFSDRVGISVRELLRILEDDRRISISTTTVDKICCEFDMLFDDFIQDALDWAAKRGQWAARVGFEDPWPWPQARGPLDWGYQCDPDPAAPQLVVVR